MSTQVDEPEDKDGDWGKVEIMPSNIDEAIKVLAGCDHFLLVAVRTKADERGAYHLTKFACSNELVMPYLVNLARKFQELQTRAMFEDDDEEDDGE